jgi:hypothetical protein
MAPVVQDSTFLSATSGNVPQDLSESPRFLGRMTRYDCDFVIHDDGLRGYSFSYKEIGRMARSFAVRLQSNAIGQGDPQRLSRSGPSRAVFEVSIVGRFSQTSTEVWAKQKSSPCGPMIGVTAHQVMRRYARLLAPT